MESTMSSGSIFALFGAMIVLASVPDTSALAVLGRTISSGFSQGLYTVIGIVVGDYIFIILAVYGLSYIAERMEAVFIVIQYMAGAYLIWLGIRIWKSKITDVEVESIKETSGLSSFMSGFLITMGDPKAILFYISFLSAFVDLSAIKFGDTIIIMIVATLSAGGLKLLYAYLGDRSRILFQSHKAKKMLNVSAAAVMITTGLYLVL